VVISNARRTFGVRWGRVRIGCLVVLLILGAAGYAGVMAGQIYFRHYAFQDQMKQTARFAETLSDSAMLVRLGVAADSLGLPYRAHQNLKVTRNQRLVTISTDYSEVLDLHVWRRVLHFKPAVVASY
jgi:hypothetical protein